MIATRTLAQTFHHLESSIYVTLLLFCFTLPLFSEKQERIVSVNGSITEILYALQLQESIVAVDSTSTYPKIASALPNVGYQRTLTTEGILNFKPSKVIGLETAGPKQTIQNLKDARIPVYLLEDDYNVTTPIKRVLEVGKLLQKQKEATILAKQIEKEIQGLQIKKTNVKVLFLYSRNPSSIFISGRDTAAHAMIELSGAKNAVTEFSDYKPLTNEALVKANPDIILMPEKSAEGFGGVNAIWQMNGIEFTRAGKEKNIILVDDLLLLGFGPRLPQVLKILNEKWKQIE